ncbi:DGQHR domain-containing protein [Vibrio parahaemolyticus]|nr:DGQHR domain-containing protein [Vibrio parahaemolyticus]
MKGMIGTWDTYNCLMRLEDIANTVDFATKLHTNTKLSDMIQRKLSGERGEEIAEYLLENKDRFFNSLVVAIYDGNPLWYDIGGLHATNTESGKLELPEYAQECMGILSIPHDQSMFALDGQHRLAGIKKAIDENDNLKDEQLSVIIVVHRNSSAGIERSRRLFTTLNKRAKLVSKDAIIALDEDDICASITRHLVENTAYLNEHNVKFSGGSLNDKTSITTLVNIFDCVEKLVSHKLDCSIKKINDQKVKTGSELEDEIYRFVESFFESTFKYVKELKITIGKKDLTNVVDKMRNKHDGGHLLYRPIGWEVYTDFVLKVYEQETMDMSSLIERIGALNLNISGEIVAKVIWSKNGKIKTPNSKDLTELQSRVLSALEIKEKV